MEYSLGILLKKFGKIFMPTVLVGHGRVDQERGAGQRGPDRHGDAHGAGARQAGEPRPSDQGPHRILSGDLQDGVQADLVRGEWMHGKVPRHRGPILQLF